MKIAMLGHKRIPSREGGVEIAVEQLAVRLAAAGHAVTVYNRRGDHVSGKENNTRPLDKKTFYHKKVRVVPIFTVEHKSLNAIIYTILAAVCASFGRYDVIHFHAEGPCFMIWLPKLLRKKTVVTIHGLDWQRAKWGGFGSRFIKFSEKLAAKYADEIIVLSKGVQNYFKMEYDRETVFVPNGVEAVKPVPADEITQKWGLTKDSYILFLARLVPEKGLHYLIEAYEKLNTDKKLVIAGGSSFSDEYTEEISKLTANNGRIVKTGFVQGKLLEELYSNAWVYVLPSDVEGMPLSLLEAMSYGNCCLVSDIPENADVVEQMGCTFRKADASDLQKKLEYLLENQEKVRQLKRDAADFICNKYNWDEVTDKTAEVYENV